MAAAVVELTGVSKRYLLGEHHGPHTSLRDALTATGRRVLRGQGATPVQEVWALRDVSLSIARGETIGFVGRNGAGKSTLLKIITRITEPTSGMSRTRGRVGALLEVGTGFHPELTGRENVQLNGAILGMARREVERRFSDIVEFAGVERFIDTPVKRYSSGMYLRLAFAVAAHLDADIMVVDEVLAVGDAEFQRRCLDRMRSFEAEGRTVLFVSHNTEAITRLCRSAIWIDNGAIRAAGRAPEVVAAYLKSSTAQSMRRTLRPAAHAPVHVTEVGLQRVDGRPAGVLARAEPFNVEIRFRLPARLPQLDLTVFVHNLRGARVFDEAWSDVCAHRPGDPGQYIALVTIPPVLTAGDYVLGVWAGTPYETYIYQEEVLQFRLRGDGGARAERIVQLGVPWKVRKVGDAAYATDGLRADQ